MQKLRLINISKKTSSEPLVAQIIMRTFALRNTLETIDFQ